MEKDRKGREEIRMERKDQRLHTDRREKRSQVIMKMGKVQRDGEGYKRERKGKRNKNGEER